MSSMRSPLGRVKGLGSAKDGTHHWIIQRLTAIALVPLSLWFVYSVLCLVDGGYGAYVEWVSNPFAATALVLFIVVAFHHAQLGLQVVIEDYVSCHALRLSSIIIVKLCAFALAAWSAVSVLSVTFGTPDVSRLLGG